MAIYTRTGDGGLTQWPGGPNIRKDDPRLEALGCLDELNAHLGLCIRFAGEAESAQGEIAETLAPLQGELLAVGAMIVAGKDTASGTAGLGEKTVNRIEQQIDAASAKAGELTSFILPGGCELACRLHVARTVCRRGERALAALARTKTPSPTVVLQYINRLSDLLFALARLANRHAGIPEATWQG